MEKIGEGANVEITAETCGVAVFRGKYFVAQYQLDSRSSVFEHRNSSILRMLARHTLAHWFQVHNRDV